MSDNAGRLEQAIGRRAVAITPLHGGCVAEVHRADFDDGEILVAKFGGAGSKLDVEAAMLRYLAGHSDLPVPDVVHGAADLLVMSYLPGSDRIGAAAERHAADLLASLHGVAGPAFGFEHSTLIGGLEQPNSWTESWLAFFAEQRLRYMAGAAHDAGRVDAAFVRRIDRLCAHLDQWLDEPKRPSLIHGDMWTGNVIVDGDQVSGFVDPAIYYADPEIELAFSTMFGTFGDAFFGRYREHRPLSTNFFDERREIYNLYPLLVHIRLFGGGYIGSAEAMLRRFGC